MKSWFLLNFFAVSLFVSASPENNNKSFATETLEINPDYSKVSWVGRKATGEHHGYVKITDGKLEIENNEIKGGSFKLDMNSIANTDIMDETSRTKLIRHLKSADFFDVDRYPVATFVITGVSRLPVDKEDHQEIKATHRIEGDLTMKGITRRIAFDASINALKGKLAATSLPFVINRMDWGVSYQSKSVASGIKDQLILDEITLVIDLVTT